MEADRKKWDRKYADKKDIGKPTQLLREYAQQIEAGKALDLACGLGRNACYLADLGFAVDAWDISEVALQKIKHPGITTRTVDLDDVVIPQDQYDLMVNTLFLDRDLFGQMKSGLCKGGLLVFETFLLEHDHVGNSAYKLRHNELLRAFSDLRVLYYREAGGMAGLVAQKTVT